MKQDKITNYVVLSNQLKIKAVFRFTLRIARGDWIIDDDRSFDREVSKLLYKGYID